MKKWFIKCQSSDKTVGNDGVGYIAEGMVGRTPRVNVVQSELDAKEYESFESAQRGILLHIDDGFLTPIHNLRAVWREAPDNFVTLNGKKYILVEVK